MRAYNSIAVDIWSVQVIFNSAHSDHVWVNGQGFKNSQDPLKEKIGDS